MRRIAMLVLVMGLVAPAAAGAHSPSYEWQAPNKSSWSCGEVKYILTYDVFRYPVTLEGMPVRQDCLQRINAGAVVMRSYHLCYDQPPGSKGYYCHSYGTHDWTFDWDPHGHYNGKPSFTVTARHVG